MIARSCRILQQLHVRQRVAVDEQNIREIAGFNLTQFVAQHRSRTLNLVADRIASTREAQ
jgi:hypothetical protein